MARRSLLKARSKTIDRKEMSAIRDSRSDLKQGSLLAKVKRTVQEHQMLQPHEPVLVALSGGADSTALLRVLLQLGYAVHAFHLNHGLRGAEADRDEAFCRALCERYAVPFLAERIDAAAYAAQVGESIETGARRLRYERLSLAADRFAESICQKAAVHTSRNDPVSIIPVNPFSMRIATAHTANDNLETMLFHLIRGTGAKGLAGIPPVRGRIIRPLLAVERREIEAWLATIGQDFVSDSSNVSSDYTRNRIRQQVIPLLQTFNPAVVPSATRLSKLLRQDEAYLQQQTQALLHAAAHRGEEAPTTSGNITRWDISWDIPLLAAASSAIQSRTLRGILEQTGMSMRDVSSRHIEAMTRLLFSDNPSASVDLPHGIRACREYDRLYLTHRDDLSISKARSPVWMEPIAVTIPFDRLLWDGRTRLILRYSKKNADIYKTFNTFYADCGTIHLETLCIRTRRQGDRIRLSEKGGRQTLKKRMIEQKIPRSRRNDLAVLADQYGIIAVQEVGIDVSRTPQGGPIIQIQFEGDGHELFYDR